jgi:putative ABC transport system substrate-binding protein
MCVSKNAGRKALSGFAGPNSGQGVAAIAVTGDVASARAAQQAARSPVNSRAVRTVVDRDAECVFGDLSGADHRASGSVEAASDLLQPVLRHGRGLCSYSPDMIDQYRRAAGYIDRILKGEKPADMPVQAPAKFEFVIHLRTARLIDLNVPAGVVSMADHVIK